MVCPESSQRRSNAEAKVEILEVSLEDLPTIEGRSYAGEWFSFDRDHVTLFDEATYTTLNRFPLSEGYPDGLVEGFHQLSALDHLLNPLIVVSGSVVAWNYGLNRVRFLSPLTVGSRVRPVGTVSKVEARGDGFVVETSTTIEVENSSRPSMVADFLVLWRRSDSNT